MVLSAPEESAGDGVAEAEILELELDWDADSLSVGGRARLGPRRVLALAVGLGAEPQRSVDLTGAGDWARPVRLDGLDASVLLVTPAESGGRVRVLRRGDSGKFLDTAHGALLNSVIAEDGVEEVWVSVRLPWSWLSSSIEPEARLRVVALASTDATSALPRDVAPDASGALGRIDRAVSVAPDLDADGLADDGLSDAEILARSEVCGATCSGGRISRRLEVSPRSFSPNADGFLDSLRLRWEGESAATVRIFDLSGRPVREREFMPLESWQWQGRDPAGVALPAGVYLIQADGATPVPVALVR